MSNSFSRTAAEAALLQSKDDGTAPLNCFPLNQVRRGHLCRDAKVLGSISISTRTKVLSPQQLLV